MVVLSKQDLDDIFSISRRYYIDDSMGDLTPHQYAAACWVKAVQHFIDTPAITFPLRPIVEPEES